jgi:hypothetical protein
MPVCTLTAFLGTLTTSTSVSSPIATLVTAYVTLSLAYTNLTTTTLGAFSLNAKAQLLPFQLATVSGSFAGSGDVVTVTVTASYFGKGTITTLTVTDFDSTKALNLLASQFPNQRITLTETVGCDVGTTVYLVELVSGTLRTISTISAAELATKHIAIPLPLMLALLGGVLTRLRRN